MESKLINEIKRDIEGSGLSSIGIGRVAINRAYKHVSTIWADTYMDLFDFLSYTKHYYKSKVMKYPTIMAEAEKHLNTIPDNILYAYGLPVKLMPIPSWLLKNAENSPDLIKYKMDISPQTYCIIRYSESLGVVIASVYDINKNNGNVGIKCTFYFIRF